MLSTGKLRGFGFKDFFDQIEIEDFSIHVINDRFTRDEWVISYLHDYGRFWMTLPSCDVDAGSLIGFRFWLCDDNPKMFDEVG